MDKPKINKNIIEEQSINDNNYQKQLCELFGKSKSTISEHITTIFKDEELDEKVVVRNYRTTTKHGAIEGKTQTSDVKYYNLDMIIALGFKVRSRSGMQFRKWAKDQAKRKQQVFLKDWEKKLDAYLAFNERDVLQNFGREKTVLKSRY